MPNGLMTITFTQYARDVERAFKQGWEKGDYDGGEHDCRMFYPTAQAAWDWSDEKRKIDALRDIYKKQ